MSFIIIMNLFGVLVLRLPKVHVLELTQHGFPQDLWEANYQEIMRHFFGLAVYKMEESCEQRLKQANRISPYRYHSSRCLKLPAPSYRGLEIIFKHTVATYSVPARCNLRIVFRVNKYSLPCLISQPQIIIRIFM